MRTLALVVVLLAANACGDVAPEPASVGDAGVDAADGGHAITSEVIYAEKQDGDVVPDGAQ
jgi:hypothetical protein